MNPSATELPRLECPRPQLDRYESLKPIASGGDEILYFFAIDLREVLGLLPRLIGSVVEAIRFLGPENCALSIIEGNSPDGTAEVLVALRPELDALTTTYYFRSSDIDPKQGDRIEKLAELRNMALQPLLDEEHRYSTNTTVIFLNDVAMCLEDILELLRQRRVLGADMTCAMDWTYVGPDPTFYDVWIARGMNGDSFFEIPRTETGIRRGTYSGTTRKRRCGSMRTSHFKSSRAGTAQRPLHHSRSSRRRFGFARLARGNAFRASRSFSAKICGTTATGRLRLFPASTWNTRMTRGSRSKT